MRPRTGLLPTAARSAAGIAALVATPAATLFAAIGDLTAQEARTETPALPPEAVPLSAESFAAWRDHIRAQPSERGWAELPWHMSFHAGLQAAAQQRRPLLLWVMNGHPFGCT